MILKQVDFRAVANIAATSDDISGEILETAGGIILAIYSTISLGNSDLFFPDNCSICLKVFIACPCSNGFHRGMHKKRAVICEENCDAQFRKMASGRVWVFVVVSLSLFFVVCRDASTGRESVAILHNDQLGWTSGKTPYNRADNRLIVRSLWWVA